LALVSANSQDLRIVVAQLTDTANFTELEQAIVSIQPRECIVLNGKMASNRLKKLEMALNRTNIEKRILDEQYNDGMVDDHKSDVQKLLHKKFLGKPKIRL
jgi:DNA mismatch repair ATPase MutS